MLVTAGIEAPLQTINRSAHSTTIMLGVVINPELIAASLVAMPVVPLEVPDSQPGDVNKPGLPWLFRRQLAFAFAACVVVMIRRVGK